MRFVSWNVNGLRACVNKGFLDAFRELDADFFCLQETKLQEGQIDLDLPGYHQYWCSAEKKGYSGTAIFTKYEPKSVTYGLGIPELDTEGRVICLEYPEFYLVTCYTPNAQRGLARIDHRLRWEEAFRSYLKELDAKKPVIICGDLNVAHKEIDLKNPGSNRGNAGFSDEERSAFSTLLDSGFTDTFRHLYPDKTGAYSWWSYMFNARANNAGWRIDYFLVSDRLKDQIYDATIHPDILGSDHCPVGLDLDTTCNGAIPIPTPTYPDSPTTKEADEGSPVGSFRIWSRVAVLAILVLLITTSVTMLIRVPEAPTPETTTATQPQDTAPPVSPAPLIHNIIDRTGTISLQTVPYSIQLTSSGYVPYYFQFSNGPQSWTLYSPSLNMFTALNATYHIQIEFDPERSFTSEDKPEITVFDLDNALSSTLKPISVPYCYYYEGDRIAGCFVFDSSIDPTSICVIAKYRDQEDTTDSIKTFPVVPSPPVTEMIVHPAIFDIEINYAISSLDHQISFVSEDQKLYIHQGPDRPDQNKWQPNFFIQVCFPNVDYTTQDHPIVEAEYLPQYLMPDGEDVELDIQYYFDEYDRIGGAFVYGYTSMDIDLKITTSFTDHRGKLSRDQRTVSISPDFTYMKTHDLAQSLLYSNELSHYICSGAEDYLNEMLQNSPALQELLSREDAIRCILNVNSYVSYGTSFDTLLTLDYFQAMMTDEEKDIFGQQKDRRIKYDSIVVPIG